MFNAATPERLYTILAELTLDTKSVHPEETELITLDIAAEEEPLLRFINELGNSNIVGLPPNFVSPHSFIAFTVVNAEAETCIGSFPFKSLSVYSDNDVMSTYCTAIYLRFKYS